MFSLFLQQSYKFVFRHCYKKNHFSVIAAPRNTEQFAKTVTT